jgi:hypothetical protein
MIIGRFRAAWAAFRNPPPRFTVKEVEGVGPVAMTFDMVTRDDNWAAIAAISRYVGEHGRA